MTKAPKRIWAWPNTSDGRGWYAAECSNEPSMAFADVEYIRADLVDPASIREAALREVSKWIRPQRNDVPAMGEEFADAILTLIDKKDTQK